MRSTVITATAGLQPFDEQLRSRGAKTHHAGTAHGKFSLRISVRLFDYRPAIA
jgi:hypothetical protein